MSDHPLVTCTPGVQGGYPCVAGTRTPVRAIVESLRIYDGDIVEILLCFEHLNREQIDSALHYYAECPELVDKDVARQEEAIAKNLSREWDHVLIADASRERE